MRKRPAKRKLPKYLSKKAVGNVIAALEKKKAPMRILARRSAEKTSAVCVDVDTICPFLVSPMERDWKETVKERERRDELASGVSRVGKYGFLLTRDQKSGKI